MLDRLKPRPGARKSTKRVGRGPGSGWNKTAGRGEKGQGHRSPGRETPFHFEGGQMSIVRRLPKRGFHNLFRTRYQVVSLNALQVFGDGATVDIPALVERGLVSKRGGPVKLLADGDAPQKVKISINGASASARRKIEEAGGSVEII